MKSVTKDYNNCNEKAIRLKEIHPSILMAPTKRKSEIKIQFCVNELVGRDTREREML